MSINSKLFDLFAPEPVILKPFKLTSVNLGFILYLPQPDLGMLRLSASVSGNDALTKCGIFTHPCELSLDSKDCLTLHLQNFTAFEIEVPTGLCIAHLVIRPYANLNVLQSVNRTR
jgi:dUTPase